MHLPLVNQFCWMRFAQLPLSDAERAAVYAYMQAQGLSMQRLFDLPPTAFSAAFPSIDYEAWHCMKSYERCKAGLQRRRTDEHLFPINSAHYPERIRQQLNDAAPPLLYHRGRVGILRNRQIAVVGRRDIRYEMRDQAYATGRLLAEAGYTVAVGYETGIAEMAAKGTLEADGTVCAYAAGGLDGVVWRQSLRHFGWQRNYCLVSPFAPERGSTESQADRRNTLLAANCAAVILLEDANDKRAAGKQYINTVGAARAAEDLTVPLFVLDPAAMPYRMPGNQHWLRRGTRSFRRVGEVVAALDQNNNGPATEAADP